MISLSSDQVSELIINLAAGLIIFVFEIVLIICLLPVVLDFWNRRRWRSARTRFILSLIDPQQTLVDRLASRIKRFFDDTEDLADDIATRWIREVLPPLFFELIPEFRTLTDKGVKQLDLYGPALTPDLHRAFIRWHAALEQFTDALEQGGQDTNHMVLNPRSDSPFPRKLADGLARRFTELDQATEALLRMARIDDQLVREGNRRVSLLPRGNLTAESWEMVGEAVESAMLSELVCRTLR